MKIYKRKPSYHGFSATFFDTKTTTTSCEWMQVYGIRGAIAGVIAAGVVAVCYASVALPLVAVSAVAGGVGSWLFWKYLNRDMEE